MRISDWSSDVFSSDLIPELGTVHAQSIPLVVLTSNGTRELSDALRRRCLYHFVDYPTEDKEARILTTRLPQVDATLALQIAAFVASVRREDLRKVPGVAETLAWAAALDGRESRHATDAPEAVADTLLRTLQTPEDRLSRTPEVTQRR